MQCKRPMLVYIAVKYIQHWLGCLLVIAFWQLGTHMRTHWIKIIITHYRLLELQTYRPKTGHHNEMYSFFWNLLLLYETIISNNSGPKVSESISENYKWHQVGSLQNVIFAISKSWKNCTEKLSLTVNVRCPHRVFMKSLIKVIQCAITNSTWK